MKLPGHAKKQSIPPNYFFWQSGILTAFLQLIQCIYIVISHVICHIKKATDSTFKQHLKMYECYCIT